MIDFPTSPTVGQVVTSPNGLSWSWNGSAWLLVGVGLGGGGSSGGGCTADSIPPPNPDVGDMWYDTTSGRTYIWYDNVWSEMTGVPSSISAMDLLGTTLAPNVVNSSLIKFGDVPQLNIKGTTSEIRLFDRDGSVDYSSLYRSGDQFLFHDSTIGNVVAGINASGVIAAKALCVQCLSTARPPAVLGTLIFETDTKRTLIHDGTNWVVLSAKGTYNPAFGNFYPGWAPVFNWAYTPGIIHITGWLDFRAGSAFYGSDSEGYGMTLPPGFTDQGPSGTVPIISKCTYYISGWQVFYGSMSKGPNAAYALAFNWDRSSGTAPWTQWSSYCHFISPTSWNIGSTMMMHAAVPGILAP